jgi:hypothetical protein
MRDRSSVGDPARTAEDKVEQLSRKVDELQTAMEAMASGPRPAARRSGRRRQSRISREHGDESPESTGLVSRRRLFGLLGGAAAAGAGLAVAGSALGADPAGAGTGNMQFGASNDAGADSTSLVSSDGAFTLGVFNTAGGAAIHAQTNSGGGHGIPIEVESASGVSALSLQTVTSSVGPPTSGSHIAGEIYQDVHATLWYCIAGSTGPSDPGTWTNLSAGKRFFPLPAPSRVFDSRFGQPNNPSNGNTQGSLTFTNPPPSAASRTIDCRWDYSTGGAIDLNIASAKALLINLTVVPVSGVGALAVYATGASQPNSSSINWSPGAVVLANGTTTACNNSQHVDVAIVATAGASTDFIIDVVGYYA